MLRRTTALLALVTACAGSAFAQFRVDVKPVAESARALSCDEVQAGAGNNYSSNTKTLRDSRYFYCTQYNGNCKDNLYRNYFARLTNDRSTRENEAYTAIGGRCETSYSPNIRGDGTLTIEMFIHFSVVDANRDGNLGDFSTQVFTIAPFGRDNQLDEWDAAIFMDGVLMSGSPRLKLDYPHGGRSVSLPPFQVDLLKVYDRWLTFTVVRENALCSLKIEDEAGVLAEFPSKTAHYLTDDKNEQAFEAHHPTSSWKRAGRPRVLQSERVPCRLDAVENNVRINSRALDRAHPRIADEDDNSVVSVRKVRFEAAPSLVISEIRPGKDGFVELYNGKSKSVDISGWILTDNVINMEARQYSPPASYARRSYVFPENTVIAPGAYFVVPYRADGRGGYGFALNGVDAVQLFVPPTATIPKVVPLSSTRVDSHFWRIAPKTSLARCPGSTPAATLEQAEFATSSEPTPGAANICVPALSPGDAPGTPAPSTATR